MFSVRVSKKKEGGGAFYFLFFIFKKRLENISERHLSIQNATSIPRLYYLLLCSNQCTHKHHFLAFLILVTTKQTKEKHIGSASSCSQKYMCVCGVCQLWNIKLEIKSN